MFRVSYDKFIVELFEVGTYVPFIIPPPIIVFAHPSNPSHFQKLDMMIEAGPFSHMLKSKQGSTYLLFKLKYLDL